MFQIHFPKPLKTSCWKKKNKKNREHIPTKGSSVTPEILDKIFSEKRILQYLKEKSGDNMTVFINENKRRLAEDSPPPPHWTTANYNLPANTARASYLSPALQCRLTK